MILNRGSKFELLHNSYADIDIYSGEHYIANIAKENDEWVISLDIDVWATQGFLNEVFCTLESE